MEPSKVAELIGSLGFPIAVAVWLIYRDSVIMKKMLGLLERIATKLERWDQ